MTTLTKICESIKNIGAKRGMEKKKKGELQSTWQASNDQMAGGLVIGT